MSQPVAPAVAPLPAGQAPAPVAPAHPSNAPSPETPPAQSQDPAPRLSTASLTASIAAQLRGEPVAVVPAADEPGHEPAPGSDAAPDPDGSRRDAGAPSEDEPPTPEEHTLPPNAVAALAQGRQQRRELKAELKAKEAVIGTLQSTLLQLQERVSAIEGNGTPKANGTNGKNGSHAPKPQTPQAAIPPELAEAQAAEAEVRDTRDWAESRLERLQSALAEGTEPEALLTELGQELATHEVTLPPTVQGTIAWLNKVRKGAEQKLLPLAVSTQILRRELGLAHVSTRQESEALAAQWVPEARDPATPRGQKLHQLQEVFPELENHPMGPRFMAAAIRGWEIVEQEATKTGNGRPAARAAAAPVVPGRPVPKLPGASSALPPRPHDQARSPGAELEKMKAAKSPDEFAAAKADWEKSLAASIALR